MVPVVLLFAAAPLAGVQRTGLNSADSVWITPVRRYDAGPIHRLLLGDLRRSLWATPVHVEVLDLGAFAGGLTPIGRGGGQQTRSLRLRGEDGRIYTFRIIDKDASRTLDALLRRSIAANVLQDQIGALLPLGALVVAPLLEAAGVLHVPPRLAVLPADPRLGEFGEEFAGVLGFVEERPDEGPDGEPGFAGSGLVIGSPRLFERLEEDPDNLVDPREFLRARLLDIFVGDWDRHPDQWRWAGFEEGGKLVFQPVPRDRDWALARIDGVLPWIASFAFPNYVGFDDEYPSAFALTWAGRALDRRLLSGLDKAGWDAVVLDLMPRLDDATIERSVRALPPPYYERIGRDLTVALKQRRDALPAMAAEFYRLLAGWTDIETTDVDEVATLERGDSRTLHVLVRSAPGGDTVFERTFTADDTREVRLYLKGGADRATVSGVDAGDIVVRIIGGGNDDTLIDQTGGKGVFFYDERGRNTIEAAPGTHFDDSEWQQPIDPTADTHMANARDWGARWIPVPSLTSEPDLGVYIGLGAIRWGYGFREYPWRTKLAFNAGIGTTTGRPRFDLLYDFPLPGSLRGRFETAFSGIERNRFHGFGNESVEDREREFYQADRSEFAASLVAVVKPGERTEVAFGPTVRLARHDPTEGTLLDSISPYGVGGFDQIGATLRLRFDSRDFALAPSRGQHVALEGRIAPALLDVTSTWGALLGQASTYLTASIPASPTLALRVGGEKTWGDVPYFEAAYIGGGQTIRGFSRQRFLGEASAYANAELRLRAFDFSFLLPGTLGVFGLADSGRVFADGEDSDRWHSAAGGGIWLSFLSPANTMSVALARSSERVGFYMRAGFLF
jgi:hypothetical protein